jgi:hypothetical protein
MQTKMHLTIQDYFNRRSNVGIQSRACNKMKSDPGIGKSPFSKALAAAHAVSKRDRQGLSIQDYLQKRIRSYSVATTAKVSPIHFKPPISRFEEPVVDDAPDTITPTVTPEMFQRSQENLPSENLPSEDRRKILASIDRAAARYKLSPALIKAVVKTESDYQVRAVSPAGAQGLMQLMPATARELGVTDPFDIDQNIQGGAQYLRRMLDQFNGNVHLALTAYNAGPGTVAKYDGKVPYPETRNYVQRVMRYAEKFSALDVT